MCVIWRGLFTVTIFAPLIPVAPIARCRTPRNPPPSLCFNTHTVDAPRIEYPCWWTYALIGPDEEGLRLAIGAITRGTQHKVAFSKESEHKKYVSLHVEVWVTSEEERNAIFEAFKSHPQVKMVL